MYVNPEHALAYENLKENFEVPPLDTGMVEVFGPWFCYGSGGFWSHDPESGLLKCHGERYFASIEPAGLSAEDSKSHDHKVASLSYLSPPVTPADVTKVHRDKPFVYEGFIFQRLFIPELGRCEMISLGRRNANSAHH